MLVKILPKKVKSLIIERPSLLRKIGGFLRKFKQKLCGVKEEIEPNEIP